MSNIKSPELTFKVKTGTILRQPNNGSLVRHLKNSNWPDKRIFDIVFKDINKTDKDALIVTILAARPVGNINFSDLYGNGYNVIVLGDVDIEQTSFNRALAGCTDNSLYTISFKVEGEIE